MIWLAVIGYIFAGVVVAAIWCKFDPPYDYEPDFTPVVALLWPLWLFIGLIVLVPYLMGVAAKKLASLF